MPIPISNNSVLVILSVPAAMFHATENLLRNNHSKKFNLSGFVLGCDVILVITFSIILSRLSTIDGISFNDLYLFIFTQ